MTESEGLIANWPFEHDLEVGPGSGLDVHNNGVTIGTVAGWKGAVFEGGGHLVVKDHPALNLGSGDFAVAGWVYTEADDVVGDVISKYDPESRCGVQFTVVTNGGMTSTAQANYRNLHFGIDNGRMEGWTDCGRPGQAVKVAALSVSNNQLYAGTLETGPDEVGHLWCFEGGTSWTDLGNPVGCNCVNAVAEFDGALYCGLGRYNCSGSALGETLNRTPGGQVYRVDPDGQWIFCGHPGAEDSMPEEIQREGYHTGKADNATAFAVYRNTLYCTHVYRTGAFVYEGGTSWKHIGPEHRLLSFVVYHDRFYALVNGGQVLRYEGGSDWSFCGHPETSTQTYSAVIHAGQLYVGTWPEGQVYRYAGGETWELLGRVGYEREIMAMALYNGKVYIGSLPMANVWRLDGGRFTFLETLDQSSAPLRRVWSMAVFGGRLYAGTLPSGRVYSTEAGKVATWDRAFPTGWHHIAAVRQGEVLTVYVDGDPVAAASGFNPQSYNLDTDTPLYIGFGMHDTFKGSMRDLRIYGRGLTVREVKRLATR